MCRHLYQRRQKSLWLVFWQILRFNRFNLLFWKLWIHWVKQALPFLYLSLASYIFVPLNKRKFSMPFKFICYFVQVVCSVYFSTFTWHHFVHSHYFDKSMHLPLFKISFIVENVNSEYVLNFYLLNEWLTTETLMHVFVHLSKWDISRAVSKTPGNIEDGVLLKTFSRISALTIIVKQSILDVCRSPGYHSGMCMLILTCIVPAVWKEIISKRMTSDFGENLSEFKWINLFYRTWKLI